MATGKTLDELKNQQLASSNLKTLKCALLRTYVLYISPVHSIHILFYVFLNIVGCRVYLSYLRLTLSSLYKRVLYIRPLRFLRFLKESRELVLTTGGYFKPYTTHLRSPVPVKLHGVRVAARNHAVPPNAAAGTDQINEPRRTWRCARQSHTNARKQQYTQTRRTRILWRYRVVATR